MSTITSVNRNNITTCLNRFLSNHQKNKILQNDFLSVIDNIDTQNAAEDFKKLPGQTSIAYDLFHKMASEGLPDTIPSTGLDWKADAVRCLLGIIYKDSQPEDKEQFDKVFCEFTKVHTHFEKDKKVAPELRYLFAKYARAALQKHILDYTQQCRNAWSYHHNVHDASVTDEDIFLPSTAACYDILDTHISQLTKPDLTWTNLICHGKYFMDTCTALSKTLRFHDTANVKPSQGAPLLENTPHTRIPEPARDNVSNSRGADTSIPAGNGHTPIIINNTAHGGNGTSTIDGRSGDPQATSFIDYGIALLKTSPEQLSREQRTQLSKQFMDLLLGRVKNGGQDRFAEHIAHASFTEEPAQSEPAQAYVKVLSSPVTMQTVEPTILLSEPQSPTEYIDITKQMPMPLHSLAATIRTLPQNAGSSFSVFNDGNSSSSENTILRQSNSVDQSAGMPDSSRNISDDTGKNLYRAATSVAQALSDLINTEGLLPKKSALSAQQMQQNTLRQTGESKGIFVNNQGQVQRLIKKFEQLNIDPRLQFQSAANRRYLDMMTSLSNVTTSVLEKPSGDLFIQPSHTSNNKPKATLVKKQVYKANKIIEPFSQKPVQLPRVESLSILSNKIDDRQSSDDLGNSI